MQTNLYGLVDNRPNSQGFGELFYVGVGNNKRMLTHGNLARKGLHRNRHVQEVFDDHTRQGLSPTCRVLAICPSHAYAFDLEVKAIKSFGRKSRGEGHLCNIAAGGNGPDAELMNDPEVLAKMSDACKFNWTIPDYRDRVVNAIRKNGKSESFRSSVSSGTRKAFENPDVRARHLAALEKVNASQSTEQRSDAQVKSYESNPERRVKVSAWAKHHNSLPEVKEAKSKASTAANFTSWQDPSIRAKRVAGMKGKKKTLSPEALEARRLNLQKALAARKKQ